MPARSGNREVPRSARDDDGRRVLRQLFRASIKAVDRHTRTKQISITIDVINARDAWPKFPFPQPGGRIGGLLARIWSLPLISADLLHCVRRVFEKIVPFIGLAVR